MQKKIEKVLRASDTSRTIMEHMGSIISIITTLSSMGKNISLR
nr:MAG TPA: hypothetical protein [Caudoviricetes sp.]DAY11462.1 MAG TPA: hypothetical protein [Caudoviricetes sp.]